jgi:hypothetical protein
LLDPYQLPAHLSVRPKLSDRLSRPASNYLIAAENRHPARRCRRGRGTKSTWGKGAGLSGILHTGRDARGSR